MAHQNARLASFLKREIGLFLLRNFPHNPEVFLSVADVLLKSSTDEAKIYVSVFPESSGAGILKDLKFYCAVARKYIGLKLRRRKIPKITFLLANTADVERLEKLLEKVKNEDSMAA